MPLSMTLAGVRRCLLFTLLALALPPTVVLPASAATAVTIVIGGRSVPLTVTPFVGSDGEVYAPADVVNLMGATFSVSGRQRTVMVTGATGRQATVPYIPRDGHECVSLQKLSEALGASTTWDAQTTTLTLRARLEMVRQNTDSLAIVTSYPVSYQVQHIGDPSRLYVDVYGLDLAAAPAAIPIVDQEGPAANVLRIRTGQIGPNTVRITIDLKHDIPYQVESTTQTARIRVALGGPARPGPAAVAGNAPSSSPALPPPPRALPPAVIAAIPPAGVRITSVSVRPVNDELTQIAVTATGQAKIPHRDAGRPGPIGV